MSVSKQDCFIVSVKVGPKGQITMPVEARKMFDIDIGDNLMILGDKKNGLRIIKGEEIYKLMDINKEGK